MEIKSLSPKILAVVDKSIGWITFNNPRRHNAMSMEMWLALADVLKQLAQDDSLRVVILKGAGPKAFVSGADISEFGEKRNSQEQRDAYEAAFDEAQNELASFKHPTIAMIQGFCVGGGMALALNCDVRIATEDSCFAIPAAKLGLGYSYDSIKILTSIVGPSFAKDILFSARFLESEEAQCIGLINQVVTRESLLEKVLEYASAVANNAPLTIGSIKAAVNEVVKDPGQMAPEYIEKLVNDCFLSEDYEEGRTAFVDKRKPVFKGS